jgi:hypothetical protein
MGVSSGFQRGKEEETIPVNNKKESKENQVESNDHLQEQLSLARSLTHSLTSRENL